MRRSSSAALAASITCAIVVDRRVQCRGRRLCGHDPWRQDDGNEPGPPGRGAGSSPAPARCRRPPRPVPPRRYNGQERGGLGDGAAVAASGAQYLAHDRRRDADLPFGGGGDVDIVVVRQPGDICEQRAKRRRGCRDQPARGLRVPAGFEEPFAEVHQMALGGQLAGPPHVVWRHPDAGEQIAAGDDFVVGDDVAIFEREDVERAQELFALEDERNRERARGASSGRAVRTGSGRQTRGAPRAQSCARPAARPPARAGRRRRRRAAGIRTRGRDRRESRERLRSAAERDEDSIRALSFQRQLSAFSHQLAVASSFRLPASGPLDGFEVASFQLPVSLTP